MSFKSNLLNYALQKNNADAFLLVSDTNRFWISEFISSYGFIFATKTNIYLLLDKRYYQNALDQIKDEAITVVCLESKNQIKDLIKKHNVKTLMVEKEYFYFDDYLFLRNEIKSIISFPSDVLRIQKTLYEIEIIKKACDITCKALNWIQLQDLVNKSEIEVANMVTSYMLDLGATKNSFDPIVASGVNGCYPHHKPTNKLIENNEFVTVDIGCVYKGYCSDVTRTFPIGVPHDKLIKAYKLVYESNSSGILNAKFKMTGNEVDFICRNIIDNSEFKDYFIHSTGHGVGINVHELPNVTSSYDKILEENSIVTIEPGIYIPNLGGIRLEDMILIKKDKTESLTSLAKKWIL